MHVLQLANFYGPRSGGIRRALDELGHGYVAAGHRRTLLVPAEHTGEVHDGRSRIVQVRAPLVPGLGGYRVILDRRAVRAAIASDPPDVIELSDKTTLVGPAIEARRCGVPVVLISHERADAVIATTVTSSRLAATAVRSFNRHLLAKVDAVVCASQFAAAEFAPIEHATPIHRVPLGVDLARFAPAVERARPELRTRPRLIAAVRLSPEKRPQVLVDASRSLIERRIGHHLTVFGDGPLRAELERRARGLPVTFAGHTDDTAALARAMADADVGLAPGPSETFGLAALEMMACGTPVVVPDQGALREVVGDGGIVARANGAAFANAIVAVLDGDRASWQSRARRQASRFTWQSTTAAMLQLHQSLVADASSGAQTAAATATLRLQPEPLLPTRSNL